MVSFSSNERVAGCRSRLILVPNIIHTGDTVAGCLGVVAGGFENESEKKEAPSDVTIFPFLGIEISRI